MYAWLIVVGPELMLSSAQLAIYLRRWCPSKYELGPFEEVVITEQTVEELKKRVIPKLPFLKHGVINKLSVLETGSLKHSGINKRTDLRAV